jgi:hypothetical protein
LLTGLLAQAVASSDNSKNRGANLFASCLLISSNHFNHLVIGSDHFSARFIEFFGQN